MSDIDNQRIIDDLKLEVERLQKELCKEKSLRITADEDCDLLALENERLRNELGSARLSQPSVSNAPLNNSLTATESQINWESIFREGDNLFAKSYFKNIPNACEGTNVLSVSFFEPVISSEYVIAGGVDKIIRAYDLQTCELVYSYPCSAPILSINAFSSYVGFSMMDGSHAILRLEKQENGSLITTKELSFKDHTKYITSIQWSEDGKYLATASSDKTVNLYLFQKSGDQNVTKVTTLRFPTTPECIVFHCTSSTASPSAAEVTRADTLTPLDDPLPLPSGDSSSTSASTPAESTTAGHHNNNNDDNNNSSDTAARDPSIGHTLIIGLRDAHYLVYLDCHSLTQRKISLNEQLWDDHCSFTTLSLSLSPSREFLLVATDKHSLILLKLETNTRVRTFAGHTSGEYGKPKVAWDSTGCYIYCNDELSNDIIVYSVCDEKIACRLIGHHGSVRDLKCHASKRLLLSASFDHSVIIWN